MPNSARDLLPLIQPATKALAQMLAGRSGASGQLGHARAILAQTERMVADRAHNRLNPAEREEFFEQVARLKLTLADADSEAEVQAMEEETPVAAPTPVNRERLKEMAMALTSSGGPTSYEDRHKASAARLHKGSGQASPEEASDTEIRNDEDLAEEPAPAEPSRPEDPNQLRLPRAGAERVAIQPGAIRSRANGRRRPASPPDATSPRASTLRAPATVGPGAALAADGSADGATDGARTKSAAPLPSATPLKAGQKLPKGWIIDDDGFVVPGPAA